MHITANINPLVHTVTVNTSARLHMGFYDLSATNKFGGLGLAIDAPATQITVAKNKITLINAKSSDNVANIVENIVKLLNVKQHFSLTTNQTIPTHAGLGSGTQIALAIGIGLNQLFNLQLSIAQIAAAVGRGKRSGIGVGAFEQGGFLVDAGKLSDAIPEITMRHAFPDNWRVLLVHDSAHVGLHGALESQAFNTLKPAQSMLSDMVFNHMIPALKRADLLAFGEYMADLQDYNGEYFTPVQGGYYASKNVEIVLNWLQQNGVACVGQSSWGPTGFAILENQQQAESLQIKAQLAFAGKPNISFQICRGKNAGATIELA
jgi:beta-ribofuranosylaminobenzene 5'-phosphate synthase